MESKLQTYLKIKDTDARCAQWIKNYRRIERLFGIADAIENVQKLSLEYWDFARSTQRNSAAED